jgi:flavin-dependent thymidylate synthase
MAVRLVSYSKATKDFEAEGLTDLQELIAFCAKVSNPAAQINSETSERLIKYLIKHQHWSPLEMVNAVIEIETTRDIAHQIVRHRSFAFQEFSQRYANPKKWAKYLLLAKHVYKTIKIDKTALIWTYQKMVWPN